MRAVLPAFPLVAFLLASTAVPAWADDLVAALRADHWTEADQAAAAYPDPVAVKLATYYRLLAPNGARATEIARFISDNPDWPQQALLARRLAEALATEGDDGVVLTQCAAQPAPTLAPALLRCADAANRAGQADLAAANVRAAWLSGVVDAPTEIAIMRTWGRVLPAEEQWRRFDRLAWQDNGAPGGPAYRQIARLDPAMRPLAEARLALRRDDAAAPALVAALPAPQRNDPAIMLEQAKWLRRAGQDDAALALWQSSGEAAERAAPPERKPAFWDERNLLIRRRLRLPDAAGAYALARGHGQSGSEQIADAEFLAGWIALRRLNRPADAVPHFQAVAQASKAAITQGRAHYWLGRTAAATRRHGRRQGRVQPGRHLGDHLLRPARGTRAGRNGRCPGRTV